MGAQTPLHGNVGVFTWRYVFILTDEYITFRGRSSVSQQCFLPHKLQETGKSINNIPLNPARRHLGETLSYIRGACPPRRRWARPTAQGKSNWILCAEHGGSAGTPES